MSRRPPRITTFEVRSLMLFAGLALGAASGAYAQSTPMAAADAQVAAAFTKADKNADGRLSRDEAATLPAVADDFDRIDADKDGAISAAEFAKAVKM
jgi:Ca2+-binding EF-hand superfamily protein